MASNKNQHFVPRCHLRPFTKDEAGAAINVFNLDRQKFIPNASVRHQCSGDYFYGKSEALENAIKAVEDAYSIAVRQVQQPHYSLQPREIKVLLRFWLLQNLRTEAASRRAVEMADESYEIAGVEDKSFRYGVREAVQAAMRNYADMLASIDDLNVCLIRNRTSVPFITSDDPAVLTSRWYLVDRRAVGMSFGIQSSGMLALLPLTPRLLALAYDGDVYRIPHREGWIDTRREADIRALNEHQLLNCFANVFVHDLGFAGEISAGYAVASNRRLVIRHRVHIATLDRREGGYAHYRVVHPEEARTAQEAIVHVQSLTTAPSSWPSFLGWKLRGWVYTNGTGLNYVRRAYAETIQSDPDFRREAARRI